MLLVLCSNWVGYVCPAPAAAEKQVNGQILSGVRLVRLLSVGTSAKQTDAVAVAAQVSQ